jgi:hypothetical protein
MKRPAALLLPAVLVLAACGGDDTGDASDAGGGVEAWCGVAQELADLSDTLDDVDPFDAGAIEAAYSELRSAADSARSAAPDEIRADVELLADSVVRVDEALAAADYSFLDVDLALLEDFGDDVDDASDRVDDFNVRECGFDPDDEIEVGGGRDPVDGDSDFDPAAGSVREQIVAGLVGSGFTSDEAACIVDNLDMTNMTDAQDDPTEMIEVFDVCDIGVERLLELGG